MNQPHPWWCGRAHYCAAERGGQHRSAPLSIRTHNATITATRTRNANGRNGIEFRTAIQLPKDETTAHQQAKQLAAQILTSTKTSN